jgi:hypothetical protein
MKTYRVDDLGHETVFHLVDDLISRDAFANWHGMLTDMALGYTRYCATGGWGGEEEFITVYRVASLLDSQVADCIIFLLNYTGMKDVYVVHKDGVARGHCLEEIEPETWVYPSEPAPWDKEKLFPKYAGVPDRNTPQKRRGE